MNLSQEELNRYSRHILLAEVGIGGQQKLKDASVLVIGAGGLGCPALMYLTAAGVGTIGIIDPDTVDSSNLQRQVLYRESDIGEPKVICAQRHLCEVNPFIDFKVYQRKLISANALEIIRDYDLIIDGSDNFATRYLVNDACVLSGKPFIYGALHRFSGQISVFNYQGGPTYRCLFPEPPAAGEVPSCAEAGVVGVLPGMIGTFQASEAIKIICGLGEVASGKLVTIDALSLSFNKFNFKKDVNAPPIQSLIDYDAFCGTKAIEDDSHVEEVSIEEFKQWQQSGKTYQLVDVREKAEYEIENINGQLIPLSQLTDRLEALNKNEAVLVHCQSGARSRQGSLLLLKHGFKKVYNLTGGMNAWKNQKK